MPMHEVYFGRGRLFSYNSQDSCWQLIWIIFLRIMCSTFLQFPRLRSFEPWTMQLSITRPALLAGESQSNLSRSLYGRLGNISSDLGWTQFEELPYASLHNDHWRREEIEGSSDSNSQACYERHWKVEAQEQKAFSFWSWNSTLYYWWLNVRIPSRQNSKSAPTSTASYHKKIEDVTVTITPHPEQGYKPPQPPLEDRVGPTLCSSEPQEAQTQEHCDTIDMGFRIERVWTGRMDPL